jgi:hypothetical protein
VSVGFAGLDQLGQAQEGKRGTPGGDAMKARVGSKSEGGIDKDLPRQARTLGALSQFEQVVGCPCRPSWCDQIPALAENHLYPYLEHTCAHRHSHDSGKLLVIERVKSPKTRSGHEYHPLGRSKKVRTAVGRPICAAGARTLVAKERKAGSTARRARQSQKENPPGRCARPEAFLAFREAPGWTTWRAAWLATRAEWPWLRDRRRTASPPWSPRPLRQ